MMIQTFRDAEVAIKRLQDELDKLRTGISTTTLNQSAEKAVVNNITNPTIQWNVRRDVIANISTGVKGDYFYATDYMHLFYHNGTTWEFGPGDPGSGWVSAGISLEGGVWASCDATATTIARNNGTILAVTTPDLTGDIHLQGSITQSTARSASPPAFQTGATTGAHQHVHAILGHTYITSGDITLPLPGGAHNVAAGTDFWVNDANHVHWWPEYPINNQEIDTANESHAHVLDGFAGFKNPDETDKSGLPRRIALIWMMRR